jgi:hypothetical protein
LMASFSKPFRFESGSISIASLRNISTTCTFSYEFASTEA